MSFEAVDDAIKNGLNSAYRQLRRGRYRAEVTAERIRDAAFSGKWRLTYMIWEEGLDPSGRLQRHGVELNDELKRLLKSINLISHMGAYWSRSQDNTLVVIRGVPERYPDLRGWLDLLDESVVNPPP